MWYCSWWLVQCDSVVLRRCCGIWFGVFVFVDLLVGLGGCLGWALVCLWASCLVFVCGVGFFSWLCGLIVLFWIY